MVQIVSTNEAVMERRLSSIPPEEWNNLSIDLTPREYVLDYLREAFPVNLMEAIEGDDPGDDDLSEDDDDVDLDDDIEEDEDDGEENE